MNPGQPPRPRDNQGSRALARPLVCGHKLGEIIELISAPAWWRKAKAEQLLLLLDHETISSIELMNLAWVASRVQLGCETTILSGGGRRMCVLSHKSGGL